MARARLLKPGFFTNAELSEVQAHGRLLFAGLWTLADREGRLKDEPRFIKGQLFPYENPPIERLLNQLASRGFIQRYEVDGKRYIQICRFREHQSPHVKEPASTVPAPDEHQASTGNSGTSPAVAVTDPVTVAETEAVTPDSAGERAPEYPFTLTYARRYAERHAGRPPPQTEHAAALALERAYGADACIQLGNDLDWQKHPNYMRPILEERKNGQLQTPGRSPGRGSNGGSGIVQPGEATAFIEAKRRANQALA